MVMERQYISADRFIEIVEHPEYDDRKVELVEGVIVDMPKPGGRHGQIAMRLSVRIGGFVEANNLGVATTSDTGFIVERNPGGRDTIRGLDIAYIKKGRVPDELPEQLIDVAPDLAVEIISPTNTSEDIHTKVRQLLNAGTPLIWLVYPGSRTVQVYTSKGAVTLEENDTLSGEDILPGFEVTVADIFPS